ncbi:MAG: DUF998 domain-containing protein [Marinirhabdus sp.]|nr:DUF998 domain-containing protein [Marinirhabdus sp.]
MRLYANLYFIAYALLVTTLFVLPLFSFDGYSMATQTLSELGAQKAPGNWYANATIIILSFSIVLLATKQLRPYWKQLAALYFFCMTFILTGIYQLAGIDAHTYVFNYTDDAIHSLFSMITGFAFCLFCAFFIFIIEKRTQKWQTLAAFTLAVIAHLLMWRYPEYRGIFQRILFLGAFGWLFYALTSYQLKMKSYSRVYIKRHKN